ncbi:MAG: hypothetical protein ACM3SW_15700 [Actinomycetota bacterium]
MRSVVSRLKVAVAEQDSPAQGHAASGKDGHTSRAEAGTNGASQIVMQIIQKQVLWKLLKTKVDLNFGEPQHTADNDWV